MQQVKEQGKCPPNQTKEEEIGNLPDKEFQIIIVKMIQNLENKMELQINSLETRIEKMQERFNKDREEREKSQYIMNNEINESERIKEKRIKRNEDNLRDLQDNIKCYHSIFYFTNPIFCFCYSTICCLQVFLISLIALFIIY